MLLRWSVFWQQSSPLSNGYNSLTLCFYNHWTTVLFTQLAWKSRSLVFFLFFLLFLWFVRCEPSFIWLNDHVISYCPRGPLYLSELAIKTTETQPCVRVSQLSIITHCNQTHLKLVKWNLCGSFSALHKLSFQIGLNIFKSKLFQTLLL